MFTNDGNSDNGYPYYNGYPLAIGEYFISHMLLLLWYGICTIIYRIIYLYTFSHFLSSMLETIPYMWDFPL